MVKKKARHHSRKPCRPVSLSPSLMLAGTCSFLILTLLSLPILSTYTTNTHIVSSSEGEGEDDRLGERARTSSGTFLARGRDEIVRNIEKRIADFTFIPRMVKNFKYVPHHDYFMDDVNTANGGDRIATMLMYLSDVEEGGETVFPTAKRNLSSVPWWNELSDCAKEGLSIKPKMGDALLFWSIKTDATYDPSSLHGSCPVI